MTESSISHYLAATATPRATDFMPFLPFKIACEEKSKDILGLVDTGASVNVLPCQIGVELRSICQQRTTLFGLTGNLANYEARVLLLLLASSFFAPVNLAFFWTLADYVP